MNIAIDIDNTITETQEYFYKLAVNYNENYLHRNCFLDNTKTMTRSDEWSEEEFKYYIENLYEPNIMNIPVRDEAAKYIKKLRDEGNKIIFVTKRGFYDWDNSDLYTEEYLKNNNFEFDRIITKATSKYKFFDDIDIFIDDSMKECEAAHENSEVTVIMIGTKYNKEYKNDNIRKLEDWQKIYDYISSIKNNIK